jgi:hypothetical protein
MTTAASIISSVPQPPTGIRMSSAQSWFTILQFIPLVQLAALGLRNLIRKRDAVLLLCLLGGLVTCTFEPLVDVLGMCYLPAKGQWTAFTLYGRHIPLLIPPVYAWYVGGMAWVTYEMLQRGIDRKGIFKVWGTLAIVTTALETPGLIANVYTYYGKGPFNIWGLPLWWSPINAFMPVAAGALIYHFRRHFDTPWKLLAIVALVPMADGFGYGGLGWPMFATLNSGLGYAGTYPAAVVLFGLVVFGLWMLSEVVVDREAHASTAPMAALRDLMGKAPAAAGESSQAAATA